MEDALWSYHGIILRALENYLNTIVCVPDSIAVSYVHTTKANYCYNGEVLNMFENTGIGPEMNWGIKNKSLWRLTLNVWTVEC